MTRDNRPGSNPSLRCLFCDRPWGEARKSDEHILPQWMRKHEQELLTRPQVAYQAGFELAEDASQFEELPTTIVTRKATLLTMKTREVCQDCNTGWMNGLEQLTEPLLLRLADAAMTGHPIVLTQAEARTLGRWAQKTALTYELTSALPRVATTIMGRTLRAGQPIRGSIVRAARHPRDYDLSIGFAHLEVSSTPDPRPGPPDRRVLLAAIVYHFVTLLVYIVDAPGQMPPPLPADGWQLLSPAFGPVEFPPLRTVPGNEITQVLTVHSHWLPMVNADRFRRADLPPQITQRN